MDPYESPDSTMSNDSPDKITKPQQQQQEDRVSSSSFRFGDSSGVAPKLIIKSMGSGSFQSTPVASNVTDCINAYPALKVTPFVQGQQTSKICIKKSLPQLIAKPVLNRHSTVGDDGAQSSENPSGHSLQKMSNLVDDINDPPVYLPNPRFLNSVKRNFLKPRRSVPALKPLGITIKKQLLQSKLEVPDLSLVDRKLEKVVNSNDAMKIRMIEKKNNAQSTLAVSTVSSSHSGIKLHIRRGLDGSTSSEIDNNTMFEKVANNPASTVQVTSNCNIMDVSKEGQDSSAVQFSSTSVITKIQNHSSDIVSTTQKHIIDSSLSGERIGRQKVVARIKPPIKKIKHSFQTVKSRDEESNVKRFFENDHVQVDQLNESIESVESDTSEIIEKSTGDNLTNNTDLEGNARRTGRKRKPTKHYMTDMVVPLSRRKKEIIDGQETTDIYLEPVTVSTISEPLVNVDHTTTPTRGRGRGRVKTAGTGRGRGRPRGSTLKAKLERLSASLINHNNELVVVKPEAEPLISSPTTDGEKKQEVTVLALPIEGDTEVNNLLKSEPTSTIKPRGRGRGRGIGTRGTRGSTRGSRGGRGAKRLRVSKKEKLAKVSIIKEPPPVQVFEEETRMSADIKPPIVDKLITNAPSTPLLSVPDEESRASNISTNSTSTTAKAKKFAKDFVEERKPVTADTLFEYRWPSLDTDADYYFLQEQITEFLGQKSFRRKYPNLRRRVVEMEERDYLREQRIVSETQCDLGLTAVNSSEVLDILFNDYPDKYEEYRKIVEERREKELTKTTVASTIGTSRDRSAEFMRRILKSCAKWNTKFNQDRKEDRSFCFDLQTSTINVPVGKHKILPPEATKMGHFPVAVLPGQYCDGYKSYTPTELNFLPLNTVMYGPVFENENAVESDESGTDSEDSSSDDDSSSTSSEDDCTDVKKSENGSTNLIFNDLISNRHGMNNSDSNSVCRTCNNDCFKNKDGRPEVLIHCAKCDVANHPTCLELTVDMVPFIQNYSWQCTDCKNCIECNDPADEDKMLFCDCCDRGYHIYCVGLRKVPTGRWHCVSCSLCHSCGVTEPSPDDRTADWHHEFKKGEKGSKHFLHSLCVSCYKTFKKGQYCPSCLKCHLKLDDKNLLECRNCEKWLHKECVKRPLQTMFGFMCDPCNISFTARTKLPSRKN